MDNETHFVAFHLPAEIVAQLDSYVVRNGVNRSAIVAAALVGFIAQWQGARRAIEGGK